MLTEIPNITIRQSRRHENEDLSKSSLRPGDGRVSSRNRKAVSYPPSMSRLPEPTTDVFPNR